MSLRPKTPSENDHLPVCMTWGSNAFGQCFTDTKQKTKCERPVIVQNLQQRHIQQISTGHTYSICVTFRHALYASGDNYDRMFCQEMLEGEIPGPCRVDFDELDDTTIVALACGRDHVTGITNKGVAVSWGRSNEFNQCGHGADGTLAGVHLGPVRAMPAGVQVLSVSCGENFSLALLASGSVYAWGQNTHGELGQQDLKDYKEPVPISGGARGVPLRSISAGFNHALALSMGGKVYSWGDNRHGQLGRPVAANQELQVARCDPTPTSLPLKSNIPFCRQISAGGWHSAMIVRKGRLFMCGRNNRGQLATPPENLESSELFTEVTCDEQFRYVACGKEHTLIVDYSGLLWGCGRNEEGQLGIGRSSPFESRLQRVALGIGDFTFTSLASTGDHTVALAVKPLHGIDRTKSADNTAGLVSGGLTRTNAIQKVNSPEKLDRAVSVAVGAQQKIQRAEASLDNRTLNPDPLSARKRNRKDQPYPERSDELNRSNNTVSTSPFTTTATTLNATGGSLNSTSGSDRGMLSTFSERANKIQFPWTQPGTVGEMRFDILYVSDAWSLMHHSDLKENWRDVANKFGKVLCTPSLLNASFLFPGMREPRLNSGGLFDVLELMVENESLPNGFHQIILQEIDKGLQIYKSFIKKGAESREQIRGLLVYLMMPQMRDWGNDNQESNSLLYNSMKTIAIIIAGMSPAGRRALVHILVDEVPQGSVLERSVLKNVMAFVNANVYLAAKRQSSNDPVLWASILLLQVVFVSNARLREKQQLEVNVHDISEKQLSKRSIPLEAFYIMSLNDNTIPPEAALREYLYMFGNNLGDSQTIAKLPTPDKLVLEGTFRWNEAAPPANFCALMIHRNLLPIAFKQKVLQYWNAYQQKVLQQQQMPPEAILQVIMANSERNDEL